MKRRAEAFAIPMVAALALLAFAGAPANDYTLDDVEIVRENPRIESLAGAAALYGDDYWAHIDAADHALYRPTTLLSYAVGRALHGPSAAGHHAVNVILHGAAAVALFSLVRALFGGAGMAFAAAALFAVHPVHVEAVAGIVGRAEILAFLGILGTVAAARRALAAQTSAAAAAWCAAAAAACFAGATSKETGIVAPAVVLLTEWLAPAKRGRRAGGARVMALAGALAAAALLVLVLRSQAVSGASVSRVFEGATAWERRLTGLRVFGENVGLLFLPIRLSAEYGIREVPLAKSALDPGVLKGAAAFIAGIAAFLHARTRIPAAAWGLGFFGITLLPISNLLFSIGVVRAERLLYAPSAGFVVALAAAAAWAVSRPPRQAWRRQFGVAALLLAIGLGLARTIDRVRDWRDNCTLAAATLATSPESPIFLTMHARCLLDAGDTTGARAALDRAFAAQADFPTAHVVAGMLEEREGDADGALAHYDALLAREPRHVVALSRSAVLLHRLGRGADAAARYAAWRDAAPYDPRPWAGLIGAAAQAGNVSYALETAREAVVRFPNDEAVRQNAATIERALSSQEAR